MNWGEIQEQWPQVERPIQQRWSKLTAGDLQQIAGQRDRLISRVQALYGITEEEAQRGVEEFTGWLQPAESGANSRKPVLLFNQNMRGIKVIAADGHVVGTVGDLLVDTGAWQVKSMQLKLDKGVADELGVPRGRFHAALVNLPIRMIQSVGDNVILTVSAEGLRPTVRAYKDAA